MDSTFTSTPPSKSLPAFGSSLSLPGNNGGGYPYHHSLSLEGEKTGAVAPASDKQFLERLARTRQVSRVCLSHFHEVQEKYVYLFPQAALHLPAPMVEASTSLPGIFAMAGVDDPLFKVQSSRFKVQSSKS